MQWAPADSQTRAASITSGSPRSRPRYRASRSVATWSMLTPSFIRIAAQMAGGDLLLFGRCACARPGGRRIRARNGNLRLRIGPEGEAWRVEPKSQSGQFESSKSNVRFTDELKLLIGGDSDFRSAIA